MSNFPNFPYPIPMIGPHQGKELELMLAGKKHLAVFGDSVPADDIILEEIIPEKAFAPYVSRGEIIRISEEYLHPKDKIRIRQVCFASPGNEWRAQAYLWIHKESREGRLPYDDTHEYFVGRLLGYDEADIQHFTENMRKRKFPASAGN